MSDKGEKGNLYGVTIAHDHIVDTQGNILSRENCDICNDPEVKALIASQVREALEEVYKLCLQKGGPAAYIGEPEGLTKWSDIRKAKDEVAKKWDTSVPPAEK